MADSKNPPSAEGSYLRRFPSVGSLLQSTYAPLGSILGECIVILDTNALLVPFGTGKDSLAQIRQTYSRLVAEKRLFVPGQVVREFSVNRPAKLTDLHHAISLKRDIGNPKAGDYPLLEATKSYSKVKELEEQVRQLLNKYRGAVGEVLEEIQGWTWNDPVSQMYREVLTPGVVFDPVLDEEAMRARMVEGIRDKLPPAYKDASKEMNADGDLRIWLTILELAATRKQHAVLVSGDAKADWSHRSNSTPIYPRFELVDEYYRVSGGKTFHIAPFSEFLKTYGAGTAVVAEVRSSERTLHLENLPHGSRSSATAILAEQAVFKWLVSEYPNLVCTPETKRMSVSDFTLSEPGGAVSTIVVQYVSDVRVFPHRMFVERLNEQLEGGKLESDDVWLFLVAGDTRVLGEVIAQVRRANVRTSQGVSIFPALLLEDGSLEVHDVLGALPKF